VWAFLATLNKVFRVMSLLPYLAGGALMWFLMLKSGVHATIAGVMLAFAIPFSSRDEDETSPSHKLEHFLHKPVAFIILPVFALANTAIPIGADWMQSLSSTNSTGIAIGLIVGKPLGVTLFCSVAVASGLCRLPPGLSWRYLFGAGILGGIGFTMSIFIANLAFAGNAEAINASKIAILAASLAAGTLGFLWFRLRGLPQPS
jgi:NhaA family Na+:H+ antiporter